MIQLTLLNGESVIINCKMIEYIEFIPESKIVMMNGKFHLVKEDEETIIEKTVNYFRRVNEGILAPANRINSENLLNEKEI